MPDQPISVNGTVEQARTLAFIGLEVWFLKSCFCSLSHHSCRGSFCCLRHQQRAPGQHAGLHRMCTSNYVSLLSSIRRLQGRMRHVPNRKQPSENLTTVAHRLGKPVCSAPTGQQLQIVEVLSGFKAAQIFFSAQPPPSYQPFLLPRGCQVFYNVC